MERMSRIYQESFWSMMRAWTAWPVGTLKSLGYDVPGTSDYRVVIKETISSVMEISGMPSPEDAVAGAMRNPIPPSSKAVVCRSIDVYKKKDDGGYDLISGLPC